LKFKINKKTYRHEYEKEGVDYRNYRAGWGVPGGVFIEEGLRGARHKAKDLDVQHGPD
jgi:hypothetical protein